MQLLAIVCWLLFIALIEAIRHGYGTRIDNFMAKHLSKIPAAKFWQFIAKISEPWLVVGYTVLLALSFFIRSQLWAAFSILLTVGLTDAIGIVVKHLIRRRRPGSQRSGYSFPSGHVLGATSLSFVIFQLFTNRVLLGLTLLLWLLVIISRLRLKAHYFSDVLGAILLATACFCSLAPWLIW